MFVDYFIVIIMGLLLGSFLNVVILRFDDLKSIVKTRSHCPKCKRNLNWYELFPFFSYIVLAGKCRTCKSSISIQYPLVELGTALVLGLMYLRFGLTLEFFVYALISLILVVIFAYDILYYMIADILPWTCIGIWIVYLAISYFIFNTSYFVLLDSLYGGFAMGGFIALLVIISREKWMGAGDIALAFLLGLISFWPNALVALFSAFTLGSIVGVIFILSKKKGMKDKLPFAPFLIVGAFIAILLGSQIINWYLNGLEF